MTERGNADNVADMTNSDDDIFILDESGVDYSPRPLHLSAMFEKVRMRQIELSEVTFESHDEATNRMRVLTNRFDEECHEKGIMFRNARLTGEKICLSECQTSDVDDMAIIRPRATDNLGENTPLSLSIHGIQGKFAGIGYRLALVDGQGGEEGSLDVEQRFRADLLYQVSNGVVNTTQAVVHLLATGKVMETELEFVENIQRNKLSEVLEILLQIDSLEIASYIDRLNSLLKSGDGTSSAFGEVIELINTIAQSQEFKGNMSRMDALGDLLRLYIPKGTYSLTTPELLQLRGGEYRPIFRTDNRLIKVKDQVISDIILERSYDRVGNTVTMREDRIVPYVVFEKQQRVCYAAMDSLLTFQ